MITELERLHPLFTQGALSPEEFATAKASLLQLPSPDLLKLDELRDDLGRVQRDWDENKRRHLNRQGYGIGSISILWMTVCCCGLSLLTFFAVLVSLFSSFFWFIAIPLLVMSCILAFLIPRSKRRLAEFTQMQRTYEARRAELEGQIAALRNQIRGEVHGS